MNNLFACHTQYDLIMSISLCKQYYCADNNDLILFADFSLKTEVEAQLKSVFSKVLILEGEYTRESKKYNNKIKNYKSGYKQLKVFIRDYYDRLFWKCDYSWPEIWLNKTLHKKNNKLAVYWLEDGAYFVPIKEVVDLKNNRIKFFARECVGKLLFGKYYSFDGYGIGSSKWTDKLCLTYPSAVRSKYTEKQYIHVDDNSFSYGVETLYKNMSIDIPENSVFILLDRTDRYKDFERVLDVITELISESIQNGKKVYFKYHPGEMSELAVLKASAAEIDKRVGAEGIYAGNIGRNIKVIGIASTSLQTAKKCGFETYSLANITGESNPEIDCFYKKIGVVTVQSISDIFN